MIYLIIQFLPCIFSVYILIIFNLKNIQKTIKNKKKYYYIYNNEFNKKRILFFFID